MIIGKGTWLDKVAYHVVEREKSLGRSLSLIRVESGLGASGIPHLGSFSDVARAYGVKMALENLGYRSELISFADDMDGLRKVPQGFPDWLNDHLAEPVSRIRDPFGCHDSFGAHMGSLLTDALDKVGIEYRYMRGSQAYKSGLLTEQVRKVLTNASKIGEKLKEGLGQEKFTKVLPYFVVCPRCGRIYTTEALSYDPRTDTVHFRCTGTTIRGKRIPGCGYEGEVDIKAGEGKLSWKVELASRWQALDIRFEAYGKDIADSVKFNDWVSDEILGYPHPYHVRYEMFLDKGGRKLSKSSGNVITPQAWLRYGTKQSLMLLMYKRIKGAREVSLEDVPTYMEEYDRLEEGYFRNQLPPKLRGLYEYVNLLKVPEKMPVHVPYRLLLQLASVAPDDNYVDFILKRLAAYGYREVDDLLIEKIKLAYNMAKDRITVQRVKVELSEQERAAVRALIELLKKERDGNAIQNGIYEIAKANGIKPAEFFRKLYMMILGSDRGPRLGFYIADVGPEKITAILEESLRS
ncbi:MAG: lysine--tRNA ligase [Nitrososphaeria archaeon]